MDLFDDAGVVKVSENLAVVTTVDYFTPVVDDPYDFGAIAAANALSDIYAMGATPISGINIAGFPEKDLPLTVLRDIIEGGLSVAMAAGVPIVGGHTVKSPEPFFGMALTGTIDPKRILTNSSARPGDLLYLTKPLGSGLITTSLKNGKADPEIVAKAIKLMKELNRSAADAVLAVFAGNDSCNCAVTDITGYGLLGHLGELLAASNVSAEIDFDSVPLMDGALELARGDNFPGGSRANLLGAESDLIWDGEFEKYEKLILADAQTSGGLLVSIQSALSGKLEAEFNSRNVSFSLIGKIVAKEKWLARIKRK